MRSFQTKSQCHADELENVTLGVLFVMDDEETSEPVLEHQGYPAAALARIVSPRDRCAGLPDAQIIIDRATWMTLGDKQKDTLLDHELEHLELVIDKEGARVYDAQDRPKLRIRKHDFQIGVFTSVAERHGENSMEMLQVRQLQEGLSQLSFSFEADAA